MNNDKISELYKKLEAQDKIINTQALEIARLKEEIKELENARYSLDRVELEERIEEAIEYIKENDLYVYIPDNDLNMDYEELANDKLLEILGEKENE